jgi:nucleoside-diphosphate-sugar epimerase
MKIVVFGATGNVGSALMRALQPSQPFSEDDLVGVARRLPGGALRAELHRRTTWHTADIGVDPLDVVAGADVVVSLAWQIQPSHDEEAMRRTNVVGNRRVAEAVVRHRVPKLVYASSVGAYSPGPKQPSIDESWPVHGVATSFYSRHKAEVEAMLDELERDHPWLDVVRMRTSLVFQRSAASEVHRLFMGRLLPWHLPRPLRLVPKTERLVFQATHATDIADAYVRAIRRDVRGAFNIAAEPPLTPDLIARSVGGRAAPIPPFVLRAAAQASWVLRLQPSQAGWLDMALETPLMDTTRARTELGWQSTISSVDALVELLDGIGAGAGDDTQPLAPRRSA